MTDLPAGAPAAVLAPGEPAPAFLVVGDEDRAYDLTSIAGRWVVLLFFATLSAPPAREAHDRVLARRALFDDIDAALYGVSIDPADRAARGLAASLPGVRYFWDFDRRLSQAYGVLAGGAFRPGAVLLDRAGRIVADAPAAEIDALLDRMEACIAEERLATSGQFAPVLVVPRVFEPELCAALIAHYDAVGGQRSGFMVERDGMTVPVENAALKRRSDVYIQDTTLQAAVKSRIEGRLSPMLVRAFGWKPSRIERYLVSCYSAEDGGFFFAHRDNTAPGTAHRKFAVTINLNAEAHTGGELRFAEFGPRLYKAPTGGAVVFGCGLLHEAMPVTAGRRYAFLPFLYDEEGARIRAANRDRVVTTAPETDTELA